MSVFRGDAEMRRAESRGRGGPVVKIGNARGLIALYLDETEAIDIAEHYGRHDLAYDEIMKAIEQAYPETT